MWDWGHVAVMVGLVVVANGGFVWAVKWLLSRDRKLLSDSISEMKARIGQQENRHEEIKRDVSRIRECMPRDYVRREDWIRSFTQIDIKIDAIWEYIRDNVAKGAGHGD